jgi:hypothetical protein
VPSAALSKRLMTLPADNQLNRQYQWLGMLGVVTILRRRKFAV